ncbi:hypothetical protein ACLWNE_07720 [Thermus oshimai]|uniref:hypothetical protein n=1 Tax=Thermus oshimai TaxID=56957 RepID=UPI0039A5D682
MKRWLFGVSLVLLLLLAFVGYRGYVALGRLEARVAALEERLSAQEEALKTLGSRVADLEKEVLQAPAEPLALPQPPEAPAPPAWPYVLGALVVALLLYLLFRLLLPSRPASLKPTFRTPFTPAGNIARPPGGAPRSRDGEPG